MIEKQLLGKVEREWSDDGSLLITVYLPTVTERPHCGTCCWALKSQDQAIGALGHPFPTCNRYRTTQLSNTSAVEAVSTCCDNR